MYLKQINTSCFTEDDVKRKGLTALKPKDLKQKIKEDTLVLDTRAAADFSVGFVPGSLFIGLEDRFAEWAGSILQLNQRMVLMTDVGKEEETIVRLARVGLNGVEGYLEGGFESWKKAGEKIDMIIDVEADELAMDILFDNNLVVVDVRKENEFAEGHVKDAINLPLNEMTDVAQIAQFEENQNIYVHSENGYRSLIAASILNKQGYHNLRNILGGWAKIKEQKNIKIEKEASVLN
jgi:hydroxyacylglutathione hydrolase